MVDYEAIVKQFYKIFLQEQNAAEFENSFRQYLTDETIEEDGYQINNLSLIEHNLHSIKLSFDKNISKFRQGSYLTLTSLSSFNTYDVKVSCLNNNNITLELSSQSSNFESFHKSDTFKLTEDVFIPLSFVYDSIFKSISHEFGKRFFELWFNSQKPLHSVIPISNRNLKSYFTQCNFNPDKSQLGFIKKCLKLPELIGLQGPPGTGKTKVLAAIACYCNKNNKNVLVLTNNHYALNNALNEIEKFDSSISIRKVHRGYNNLNLHPSIEITNQFSFSAPDSKKTILGTTLHYAAYKLLSNYGDHPDIVFIDEASQVPFHIAFSLANIKAKSFVFLGDDMQMPPIFNETISEEPLAISILDAFKRKFPESYFRLNITYRMNKALTSVVGKNTYVYKNKIFLKSSEISKNRKLTLRKDCTNIQLRDIVSPDNSFVWIETPINFSTQSNKIEAYICALIIIELKKLGVKTEDICVVSPFKRQISLIKNEILKLYPEISDFPIIDTVERIQGQSVEVVIITYVASDAGYIENVSNFIFSENRLNVAISRASTKVIFLCSNAIFDAFPNTYKNLINQKHLREKKEMAYIISNNEIESLINLSG